MCNFKITLKVFWTNQFFKYLRSNLSQINFTWSKIKKLFTQNQRYTLWSSFYHYTYLESWTNLCVKALTMQVHPVLTYQDSYTLSRSHFLVAQTLNHNSVANTNLALWFTNISLHGYQVNPEFTKIWNYQGCDRATIIKWRQI